MVLRETFNEKERFGIKELVTPSTLLWLTVLNNPPNVYYYVYFVRRITDYVLLKSNYKFTLIVTNSRITRVNTI